MSRTSADIVQIVPNPRGKTYVLGDVHGCCDSLRHLLAILKPKDTLIIGGDLFDRGLNSIGVYDAIQKAISEGKKIHVVCGNHEINFLGAMRALLAEDLFSISDTDKALLLLHFQCGGSWIIPSIEDLPYLKVRSVVGWMRSQTRDASLPSYARWAYLLASPDIEKKSDALIRFFREEFKRYVEVHPDHLEKLKSIQRYCEAMPYIAFVGNDNLKGNPFFVCHAKMPLQDTAVLAKLRLRQVSLTEAQKEMVTLSRDLGADRLYFRSYPAYVGHNIVSAMFPVVPDRRHILIDFGAYKDPNNTLLVVNHTDKTVFFATKDGLITVDELNSVIDPQKIDSARELENYLQTLPLLEPALLEMQIESSIRALKRDEERKAAEAARMASYLKCRAEAQEDLHKRDIEALRFLKEDLKKHKETVLSALKEPLLGSIESKEIDKMLVEVERLLTNPSRPSQWWPDELATDSPSKFCGFWKTTDRTPLNQLHDRVKWFVEQEVKRRTQATQATSSLTLRME